MPVYNKFVFYIVLLFFANAFICATYNYYLPLIAYMLFVPFVDTKWLAQLVLFKMNRYSVLALVTCIVFIAGIAGVDYQLWKTIGFILITAALPEEWFFRAYLQNKLGNTFSSVFLVSVLFSLGHAITVSWLQAALVFLPSLVYGTIYLRSRNFPLIVLLHLISNLIYQLYQGQL